MDKPIHQEVVLKSSPERVFEALMNEQQHGAFTGAPARISRKAGGSFSCHGGQIEGRNIELVANRRIVQAWRVAAWEPGVYSVVRFELQPQGAQTRVVLDHAGVPAPFQEAVGQGWQARYWGPLRKYLA